MRPGLLNHLRVALILMLAGPSYCFGENLKLGEPAPDFAVASVDGRSTIRLSDFRGRRVLIFNWATW